MVGSLVIRGSIEREAFCDMSSTELANGLATYVDRALKQNDVRLVDLCTHPDNEGEPLVHIVVCLCMQEIALEDYE